MRSSTLDENDLRAFCLKHNFPFSIIDLSQLESASAKNCFIYTGSESDSFNNGYNHHWLFLHGNKLFDSYGKQEHYNLPEFIEPVKTYPSQLQSYNTNVCGEYCCAFYYFIKTTGNKDYNNLGSHFTTAFQFTSDKNKNDATVNDWFEEASQ